MAITLSVEDFSCLQAGRIEISPVTVIIGPQGAGKSVTTKLIYFFIDLLSKQYASAERNIDVEDFRKEAARQFRIWFPPSAWGRGRFNINFSAGLYTVRALRRMSRGEVSDDVAITFSPFFSEFYRGLQDQYSHFNASKKDFSGDDLRRSVDSVWKIRDAGEKDLAKTLGDDFIGFQTFVPAGRAFFTSIGRLVAAIEQGSSLDPVTIRFAKLFANLRDHGGYRYVYEEGRSSEQRSARLRVMRRLFGGEIKIEGDQEYVLTTDGRKVPFTALSSGQQELLPMWMLIDFFASRGDREIGELFYIEEPEAHLFPTAQSLLLDYLISSLVSRTSKRSLILTTHSPYILAKINNYLKAGALGRRKRYRESVSKIISQDHWLSGGAVSAYAIHDGHFESLIRDDGLIDGEYIDQVSDEVAQEFESLLDIQYEDT